jgi:DNA-directed RNA polymerase subunit RPC12/RpoP
MAMKDNYYLKCSCMNCGSHIEFPAIGEGKTVNCPHCGRPTRLKLDETKPKTPARKSPGTGVLLAIACLLLAGVAAGIFIFRHKGNQITPAPLAKVATAHTNIPPPQATNTGTSAVAKAKKSASDLKVGEVKLEKTKGTSLVYAVGTVTNASDYQRFGVKVELDLFNQKDKKIGTAQDYISILEPRREWQFRALIPDSKTVTAKMSTLKEEE